PQESAAVSGISRLLWFGPFLAAAAAYGATACAVCHPGEAARFLASPMGRSIGPPQSIGTGTVTHSASGSALSVEYRDGRMFHLLSELGLKAEYQVAWQIGSGIKGRTYAVQIGQYLLESPLSWYEASGWDVSPGFESLQLLDFNRPITANCLFCHAGKTKF